MENDARVELVTLVGRDDNVIGVEKKLRFRASPGSFTPWLGLLLGRAAMEARLTTLT